MTKEVWVLMAVFLSPTEPRDHYPMRLRNVLDSPRPTTSQIEWTATWIGGRDAGLVERYVTRRAGDAVWESNLGDENGYHPVEFSAGQVGSFEKKPPQHGVPSEQSPITEEESLRRREIPKEETAGTRNSLIYDGQAWNLRRAERPLSGTTQTLEDVRAWLPVDLPSIGLAPCWLHDLAANPYRLPNWDFEGFNSSAFRERIENGLPTASAEWDSGRSRLTWHFDDRYGGNPVWAGFERDGTLLEWSETEYERIGARWFPKSVRFYEADSSTPYKMIDVQRATFDEPWHMQEITPTDIGALYGTWFSTPEGTKAWTGVELIPMKEFWDLVNIDGVLPDRRILVMMAEIQHQTLEEHLQFLERRSIQERTAYRKKYGDEPWLVKKSPKEKDEWDVYVEKFLGEHKLPEPGVKRANEVRDQAKKLRDVYRRKKEAELRKAKEDIDSRKVADYEGSEKRIFDRVLVRELKKLVQDEKKSPRNEP